MNLKPFKLERYFAKYEFSAKYLLSSSDCDGLAQSELLKLADSETMELWDKLSLGYTESLGHPILRDEISKLYKGISPNECLVVTPEEGIYIALSCILQKGDHVVCTTPGYQSLCEIAEGLGCEVTKWEPDEANGWRFNPEHLERSIKSSTKLIIINFPHNPTGYLPSHEDFQRIVEVSRKNKLHIFSDEMYRFLEYKSEDRLPAACESYERAVSLFGISKTFGMAGVRIGWVVTKDNDLFTKMATLKDYTTICSSAPSEILAIIALKAKDRLIQTHLTRIKTNLGLLDGFFDRFRVRFEWIKPKAGTIAFPKIVDGQDAFEFCQKVVNETGIMLLPASVYDYDNKHFRIGFGRINMPEVLERFEDYLLRNG